MSKQAKSAPQAQVQAPAPVALYIAVGPKRGLTGTGHGRYSNEATMAAFMAITNSKTGLPLATYHEVATARGHKGFTSYAVKYGWLQPVPPAGSPLAVGPV